MGIKKYFTINSEEWKVTVKWSLMLGVFIGLVSGVSILIN